jgi:Ca-activated chloride channel homolog
MSEWHFLRPHMFYLLIPLILLLAALWRRKLKFGGWGQVCDEQLLPYILQGDAKNRYLPFAMLSLTGLIGIVALAGPTWERVSLPLVQEKSGLVIALDLSPGMNSEDVKPTRLQRAIYKVNDILQKRREGETALVVYTDEAFVVTPLTDDVRTISALLPSIDTTIMPTHGLNHEKAVALGAELLKQGGITKGSILLITTGAAGGFANPGMPVSVLGVGTEQGAPVPKGNGGFMLDEKGGVIISKLEKAKLAKLAEATGGRFALLSSDESDIKTLLYSKDSSYGTKDSQVHWQWLDGGYWLLLLLLPFAAWLLRRGDLSIALIVLSAQLEAGFWSTSDQIGQKLFAREEYAEAAGEFQDRNWQGAAHYKGKNYQEAADCFAQDKSANGYYNYGNSLAMLGSYGEAIAAYEKALELQPDHEDAAYNKKILEEEQKKKEDQEQDEDQQDKDQDKQKNGDKDEQKNKEEQSGDEQSQEPNQEDKEEYSRQVEKELQQQQEPEQQVAEAECDPQREIDDRWLERVPDDPGGLLRRKFLYQYKKGRS